MKWYYADAGRQVGPVEDAQLDELVSSGAVRDDTLIWREGMANWQPHSAVRGPAKPLPIPAAVPIASETRFCSECGRPYPAHEMVTIGTATVCAQCKPLYMQRVREGGQPLGVRRYAGFWIRFVARIIDGIILGIVSLIVNLPIQAVFGLSAARIGSSGGDLATAMPMLLGTIGISLAVNIIIQGAYEIYFLSSRGATIGKLALGLKVIRADGGGLSVGQAAGRFFAFLLDSYFTLTIGFIIAGFDSEKRSLHDRICDTRVIYAK